MLIRFMLLTLLLFFVGCDGPPATTTRDIPADASSEIKVYPHNNKFSLAFEGPYSYESINDLMEDKYPNFEVLKITHYEKSWRSVYYVSVKKKAISTQPGV